MAKVEGSPAGPDREAQLNAAINEINFGLGAGDLWDAVTLYDAIQKELKPDDPQQFIDAINDAKETIGFKLEDPETLQELLNTVDASLLKAEQALNSNDLITAETVLEECKNVTLVLNQINKEKFKVKGEVFLKYQELKKRLDEAKAAASRSTGPEENTAKMSSEPEEKSPPTPEPAETAETQISTILDELARQLEILQENAEDVSEPDSLTLERLKEYKENLFAADKQKVESLVATLSPDKRESFNNRLQELQSHLGEIPLTIVQANIIEINSLIGAGDLTKADEQRKSLQADFDKNRRVIPFEHRQVIADQLSKLWERMQQLKGSEEKPKMEKKVSSTEEITIDDVESNPPEALSKFIDFIQDVEKRLTTNLALNELLSLLQQVNQQIRDTEKRFTDPDTGRYRKEKEYFEIKEYIDSIPGTVTEDLSNKIKEKALAEDLLLTNIQTEKAANVSPNDPDAKNKWSDIQRNLKQLRNQFETKYRSVYSINSILNDWYLEVLSQIDEKLSNVDQELDNLASSPVSTREKDVQLTKQSLERFFLRRGLPLREDKAEYKDFQTYLQVLHEGILKIAVTTVWNQLLDKSGGSKPRTVSYELDPMIGPVSEIDLLQNQLIYTKEENQGVFSLESLLDQLQFYFSDPIEATKANDFAEKLKKLLNEVSVWHNRAYIRRHNESMEGPEGALKALTEIAHNKGLIPNLEGLLTVRKEATEAEKKFKEAIEYGVGVWSVISLKQYERQRLWPLIDPKIKSTYFEVEKTKDEKGNFVPSNPPRYVLKSDYDVFPLNNSTEDKKKHFVDKIISDMVSLGVPLSQAQLAYHIAETYRIGSGLEAFWDVKYLSPKRQSDIPNTSVIAKEGEPKGANIGLYVESAWRNPVRPDFNIVYKDHLVHGYIPFNRALQLTHDFKVNGKGAQISEFPDNRASVAEILAVKGAIDTVNWHSASTGPDEIIAGAAVQAIKFWWPGASISKSVKPENSFFLDVRNIPLSTNILIDREDETVPLQYEFGAYGKIMKNLGGFMKRITLHPKLEDVEVFGFRSDSTPISGDRNQHLRNLYKNLRDYWISPFSIDERRYPCDQMRMMRFMFSRDDTPDGYVNQKIGEKIETIKDAASKTGFKDQAAVKDFIDNQVKGWKDWLVGYLTYDLLMRSVYYLLQPDFRNVQELKGKSGDADPQMVEKVYNSVDFANFENLLTTTVGGARLLNVSQLMYLINQSMLLQQQFPDETSKIAKSGYSLFESKKGSNIRKDANGEETGLYIFSHEDLLRLAKSFHMGEGYHYIVQKDSNGQPFMQLERDKGIKPTVQWLIDRLTLLTYLFKRDNLKLTK